MDKQKIFAAGAELIKQAGRVIVEDENVKGTIFGTYTNGKPRSMIDALNGEVIHPRDKLIIAKRIEKNEKKKKKKKKKGKKYAQIDLNA